MNFSVLISIYKKENHIYFDLAMESILINQSVKPSEIILIKDGPLNFDLDLIIKKYLKLFPEILKVFGYDENKGLGYALNFGLNKCSHNIVFRMDTDDIAKSNRFKSQLEFFQKTNDIVILGSCIEEFIDSPNDINRFRNVPLSSADIERKKYIRNPFNHMTVAFKKDIIINAGGYVDMPGYEDYYLWLRVLRTHKGKNLKNSLVYARVGNNMIGRRHGYDFLKRIKVST